MIYLLFDASAVVPFYLPETEKQKDIISYLTVKKTGNQAFFYIPVFCIAETINTFAKKRYRWKIVSKKEYQDAKQSFTKHVRDRNFFYCYYLNRYHNYNAEEVYPLEHNFRTEYTVTGLDPRKTSPLEVNRKLKEKRSSDHLGRYYLSASDILVISMARELSNIHGKYFGLVTGDKRMYDVASRLQKPFRIFYMNDKLNELRDYFDYTFKRGK